MGSQRFVSCLFGLGRALSSGSVLAQIKPASKTHLNGKVT
jgi:hypothetical protein